MSSQDFLALLSPEHIVTTALALAVAVVVMVILLVFGCQVARRRRVRRLATQPDGQTDSPTQ